MARVNPIVNDFTGGELSPQLHQRSNLDIYPKGCRDLKHMVVRVNGPAKKREGSYYIAAVKDSADNGLLIPFEASSDQDYIIEAGDLYFRFYTDGGQVLDGGPPYEIVSPYAHTELADLKWVQASDTMYLVHPLHKIHKLVRTSSTNWTLTELDYQDGPWLRKQNNTSTTISSVGLFYGSGVSLTSSADLWDSDHVGANWRFIVDSEEAVNISAISIGTGAIAVDEGETLKCFLSGTWVGTVTLQRNFNGGGWTNYLSYTANTSFEIEGIEDGYDYRWLSTAWTSGTCNARLSKPIETTCEITAVAGPQSATATVTGTTLTQALNGEENWYEGAWSDYRGFPSAICFHEQRLVVAATTYEPQTVWGSVVGDFESMAVGSAADDDAYNHTIASSMRSDIRWLHSGTLLIVGATGGTWTMGLVDVDSPITPASPNIKRGSSYGSANIQAIEAGEAPLYLRRAGKNKVLGWELLAVGYELASDKWVSRPLSERAEHLFQDGITAMAYADQPIPTLWMVRSDGALVSATISLGAGVVAFSEHLARTGGSYESVAVIPGDDRDEVWFLVKRSINGSDVRYVEQLTTHKWTALEDAIYMDAAITYDGVAATTITGLSHLEGETVGVLVDGANHPDRTVASGQITLQESAEKVQIGLKYTATLRPTRIDAGTRAGSSLGAKRYTSDIIVSVIDTLGLKYGTDLDELDEYEFRDADDPMDSAPPLFTGELEDVSPPGGYDREGSIYLVNDYPFPFEVASVRPTMQASDM